MTRMNKTITAAAAALIMTIGAGAAHATSDDHKTTICHWANGHPHTITIDDHALEGHFDHGQPVPGHEQDSFGECPDETTTTTEPTTTTTTTVIDTTTTTSPPQTTTTTSQPSVDVSTRTITTPEVTSTPTSSTTPPSTLTSSPTSKQAPTSLPRTGVETEVISSLGFLLIAAGQGLRRFKK